MKLHAAVAITPQETVEHGNYAELFVLGWLCKTLLTLHSRRHNGTPCEVTETLILAFGQVIGFSQNWADLHAAYLLVGNSFSQPLRPLGLIHVTASDEMGGSARQSLTINVANAIEVIPVQVTNSGPDHRQHLSHDHGHANDSGAS